jgi:hypothetical protein
MTRDVSASIDYNLAQGPAMHCVATKIVYGDGTTQE